MRAWLVILLMVPVAAGQGHTHAMGDGFAVVTDLGPEGIAHVGSPVHFELIAFGDDLVPDFHQDLPFRITLDNVTLYEATTLSGHDYDGVHGVDIVFPRPGTWRASALADGEEVAYREGEVRAVGLRPVDVEATIQQSDPPQYVFDILEDGARVNHSDLWVEVLQDGRKVLATHLHIHDEAASMRLGHFSETGAEIRATAYTAFPGSVPSIAPAMTSFQVTPGGAGLVPMAQAPHTAKNVAEVAPSGSYTLVGTYDPFTIVGPDTLQHLNVLVMDPETGMPVQHVDFEAVFRGPRGLIFSSFDLHEYDGIYTLEARQLIPGQYILDVSASRGDWSGTIRLSYLVAPPVVPSVFGPQLVSLAADSMTTSATGDITWSIANPAGLPFAHGEIDMQVRDSDGLVILRDKLHTHNDGTFPVRAAFLDPGTYTFELEPFPLDPQPVGPYYRDTVGTPLAFSIDVGGAAAGWPAPIQEPDGTPAPAEATPLPIALLFFALAAALLARKR